MALFNDGTISTLDDLTAHDTTVLDVASAEGVDAARKLELAQEQIGIDLDVMLAQVNQWEWQGPDHHSVVVTPPLKLWHTLYTLALIYQEAFNSQLNERYRGKRDQFERLARQAADRVRVAGLGVALMPLPQPGQPSVTATAGSMAAGIYAAATCWVNQSGDESCMSPVAVVVIESGQGFTVDPGESPAHATGWNIFAGVSAEALGKQNDAVLAIGESWKQSSTPSTNRRRPGTGQSPSYIRPVPRVLQRG